MSERLIFKDERERRREALGEQHRQADADTAQGVEEGDIADAEPEDGHVQDQHGEQQQLDEMPVGFRAGQRHHAKRKPARRGHGDAQVALEDDYAPGKDAQVTVRLEALPDVPTASIDDLKLAIDSLEPAQADLLLLLATLRYRTGKLGEAESHFKAAINADPLPLARQRAQELEAALAVLSSFDEGVDLVLYFKHLMVLQGHEAYALHFNPSDALSDSQKNYATQQFELFKRWYASWPGRA